MKKIAYIRSGSFYDDSRATKEVKALSEAGYAIHIIGWDRDGNALEKCKAIFNEKVTYSFYKKKIDGFIGYKGILKLLGFLLFVKQQLKENASELFAVHACDLDGGVGAYSICKKVGISLVYDIYDYYIDSHNISGLLGEIIEKQEIRLINLAKATIICTEERKAQISKARPRKIVVIYNSPEIKSVSKKKQKYDYSYCGAFGGGRLLEEVIAEYSDNSDLVFTFAGSGKFDAIIKKNSEQFENFHYLGPISYDDVLKVESESAVISAIYNPNKRNHVLCAPNKFYEALALGKPVIVCKGTGIDKIVTENHLGYAIEYDAKEFFRTLRILLDDKNESKAMGERGRNLYETLYNWENMKKKLISIYEGL